MRFDMYMNTYILSFRLWGKACGVKLDLSNSKNRKTSESAFTERSLATVRSGESRLNVNLLGTCTVSG